MYPLAEPANPKPTRSADNRLLSLHALPFYDIRALQDIHDIISVEPVQPRDKVMMGMLATIGIESGKPFNPPTKLKAAIEQAWQTQCAAYLRKTIRPRRCLKPFAKPPASIRGRDDWPKVRWAALPVFARATSSRG